jgi:hypothetical protein
MRWFDVTYVYTLSLQYHFFIFPKWSDHNLQAYSARVVSEPVVNAVLFWLPRGISILFTIHRHRSEAKPSADIFQSRLPWYSCSISVNDVGEGSMLKCCTKFKSSKVELICPRKT